MTKIRVQVTRNFSHNLDEIETFLTEVKAEETFQALLDDLFEQVIPTLEEHPDIRSDFLKRRAATQESAILCSQLQQKVGAESLRELIRGDYILLYARQKNSLFLLAIKHHRQLSFDFIERWT